MTAIDNYEKFNFKILSGKTTKLDDQERNRLERKGIDMGKSNTPSSLQNQCRNSN